MDDQESKGGLTDKAIDAYQLVDILWQVVVVEYHKPDSDL